ncbi:unnamed protein product [Linum trigynum]|uniref:Uncharacterized protein n=1 Tax=Linum trigynum TaxID=586398 RepID=A0AAV2DIN2_9ROSI
MSTVFSLTSDNEFISLIDDTRVEVRRYKGDVNNFNTIRRTDYASDNHWGIPAVEVGPGEGYEALEVFGTAIEGENFKQLVKELKAVEDGEKIHFFVNRLGLCMISRINHPTIKAMRINDYFGWSKYGVKLPRDVTKFTVWSRADMHSGETLVDSRGMGRASEEAEKGARGEGNGTGGMQEGIGGEGHGAGGMQQGAGVEAKEKEVEMLNSQLLAFKARHEDVE